MTKKAKLTIEVNANRKAVQESMSRTEERERKEKRGKKAPKPSREEQLSREIDGIYRALATSVSDSMVVLKERVKDGSACKGKVMVMNRAEYTRYLTEVSERQRQKSEGVPHDFLPAVRAAEPLLTYAFYPSVYNAAQIGSIAIYGEDALPRFALAKKMGYIFGRRIKSAEIAVGLRQFAVIKLAAS